MLFVSLAPDGRGADQRRDLKTALALAAAPQPLGEPLDWQASIVRNLMRIVDGFCFYLVAAITVWVSKRKQRLGDMAAHTLVVKARIIIPFLVVLAFGGFHHPESQAAKLGRLRALDVGPRAQAAEDGESFLQLHPRG